ncbi:MAG: pyridoxal-phosphate dependent enzyme [Spirosomataceae bacterium]
MGNIISFWENTAQTPLQIVEDPIFIERGIKLYIKRDDLIHPLVSGNKWRKLKYNFLEAEKLKFDTLFTFGGAYSNHIAAVAAAGQATDFKTIGIIRGEELNEASNSTLRFAANCGMKLIFVSRSDYKDKEYLVQLYGQGCFIIPEGGSNPLAVRGISEVMGEINTQLGMPSEYVCTSLGTGGTAAGLIEGHAKKVLVFPSLKITEVAAKTMISNHLLHEVLNVEVMPDYHFGGYGKVNDVLWNFIKIFEEQTQIPLEQVYTGKMLFGTYDLIKKGYFPRGSVIVVLHTGGLQGKRY